MKKKTKRFLVTCTHVQCNGKMGMRDTRTTSEIASTSIQSVHVYLNRAMAHLFIGIDEL